MNQERLSMLAHRHAPIVAANTTDERTDRTILTLSCGHDAECAPHFDAKQIKTWHCRPCGEAFVRTNSRYQNEFKK